MWPTGLLQFLINLRNCTLFATSVVLITAAEMMHFDWDWRIAVMHRFLLPRFDCILYFCVHCYNLQLWTIQSITCLSHNQTSSSVLMRCKYSTVSKPLRQFFKNQLQRSWSTRNDCKLNTKTITITTIFPPLSQTLTQSYTTISVSHGFHCTNWFSGRYFRQQVFCTRRLLPCIFPMGSNEQHWFHFGEVADYSSHS